MIRGRILVIDGDEWLGPLLVRVLQEKGFMADFRDEARAGFQRACDSLPDAVVCSVVLPDIDGFWVARRLRTEVGPVSKTPLVLVGEADDKDARIQGLQVGADVLLERPVTNDEIVAQVEALVAMARRFRHEGGEEQSAPSLAAAFRGDLSNFPLASVLMMLEMERRTGSLEVVSGSDKRALLVLSGGALRDHGARRRPGGGDRACSARSSRGARAASRSARAMWARCRRRVARSARWSSRHAPRRRTEERRLGVSREARCCACGGPGDGGADGGCSRGSEDLDRQGLHPREGARPFRLHLRETPRPGAERCGRARATPLGALAALGAVAAVSDTSP